MRKESKYDKEERERRNFENSLILYEAEVLDEYKKEQREKTRKLFKEIMLFFSGFAYMLAGIATFMFVGMFLAVAHLEGAVITPKGALGLFAVTIAGLSAIFVWLELWKASGAKNE